MSGFIFLCLDTRTDHWLGCCVVLIQPSGVLLCNQMNNCQFPSNKKTDFLSLIKLTGKPKSLCTVKCWEDRHNGMFLLLNRVIYRYRTLPDKVLNYSKYGGVNVKLLEKIVPNDILNDENFRYFTHKLYNTFYYFTLVKVKFKEKKWFKLKMNYAGCLP